MKVNFQKHRVLTNKSIIYPALIAIGQASEKASLLNLARRRFGRYVTVELLVFSSLILGTIMLFVSPLLAPSVRVVLAILYLFRILTMAIAQISILLLGSGKSTPGDRIHSRIRYLAITFMNWIEIVLFGSLYVFALQDLGQTSVHFVGVFNSGSDVFFYNLGVALGFNTFGIEPLTFASGMHRVIIRLFTMELVVVVLAIILAIKPEDEAVTKERILPLQDYWEWRSYIYDELSWPRDNGLRQLIVNKLNNRGIQSIADIGCGVGHLSATLASEGYQVIGIDNSPNMIEMASKLYAIPSIKYQNGDANHLPLPDKSVDAVVMRMLLHNVLPDWRPPIAEAKRVLRSGGTLLIIEGFPPNEECRSFFIDVLSRIHERHFFRLESLIEEIRLRGFSIESQDTMIVPKVSVKSWLTNAVPDPTIRKKLMNTHMEMAPNLKQAYEFVAIDGDALINLHFTLIVATIA